VPTESERVRAAAVNQSRVHDANERLRQIVPSYGFKAEDRAPFMCECTDDRCVASVMLTLDEYDRVRAHSRWFVLVAGHEDDRPPRHERVLEAEHGYAIVEKIGIAEAARLRESSHSLTG
jgi:hypothetical protein